MEKKYINKNIEIELKQKNAGKSWINSKKMEDYVSIDIVKGYRSTQGIANVKNGNIDKILYDNPYILTQKQKENIYKKVKLLIKKCINSNTWNFEEV